MKTTTFLSKCPGITTLLFLLLHLLLTSCEKESTESKLVEDAIALVVGEYHGYYRIGTDTFPDIMVKVEWHLEDRIRLGSASDLIRPFSSTMVPNGHSLMKSEEYADTFVSFLITDSTRNQMSVVYGDTDAQFVGQMLF